MRRAPDINTDITPGYASLLAHNWDTVQESYDLHIPEPLAERLEFHKSMAGEKESPVDFSFGGEGFQIWVGSSQGKKWVIEHDDFQIHFGSPKQKWPITVRYLSGGLWEHGFDALKARVLSCLLKEALPVGEYGVWEQPETWQRCSRADYAFDFYSPKFSAEMATMRMREKMVLPSGVKMGAVGPSIRDETLTIGMRRAGLVIQVYDKGQEIRDRMAGKTWMFKVWEREGYLPPTDEEMGRHCWRVETRFGKEFLKDRGILNFAQVQDQIRELLGEALMARRMVERVENDSHRERWPLHPMWAAAYNAAGKAGSYLPIGRQVTLRRDAMIDCLEKQITGTVRSLATLDGEYNEKIAQHKAENCVDEIARDREHAQKVEKIKQRYRFLKDAK